MKKTLYIHAGTEKTGSTSLQHFLMTDGKLLEDHGFHFLRSGGVGRTGAIQFTATLCRPKMRLGELAYQNAHVLRRRLIAEVRQSGHEKFISSSEHLHSRINVPAQLDELKDVFYAAGITDFKVIFFIRNQIDLLRSRISTQMKGGRINVYRDSPFRKHMFRLVPKTVNAYGNYKQMLDLWSDAFGKENLIVRNYDKTHDVIASFLDILGIKQLAPAVANNTDARLNTALDKISLFVLANFDSRYPNDREVYAWLRETLQDVKFKYRTDPMPVSIQLRIWLNFLWSNYQLGRKWPELRGLSRRGFVWGRSLWFRKPTNIETDLLDVLALIGQKKKSGQDAAPAMLLDIRESLGSRGVLHKGFDFGFHQPEEWGCWTKENVAALRLELPDCASQELIQIILHVRLKSFYKVKNKLPVARIYFNEAMVFHGAVSDNFEIIEMDVPLDSVATGRTNRLIYETNTLMSPSEVSNSPDTRKLGLGICYIHLKYIYAEETHLISPRSSLPRSSSVDVD